MDEITKIIEKFNSIIQAGCDIGFNTGCSNNDIRQIKHLSERMFLIDEWQVEIIKIWVSLSPRLYDDLLIFETKSPPLVTIDGKITSHISIINGEKTVPTSLLEAGYIRYNNEILPVENLDIENRYILSNDSEPYLAIGCHSHCAMIPQNDSLIWKLQSEGIISTETITILKREIAKQKDRDVIERL